MNARIALTSLIDMIVPVSVGAFVMAGCAALSTITANEFGAQLEQWLRSFRALS